MPGTPCRGAYREEAYPYSLLGRLNEMRLIPFSTDLVFWDIEAEEMFAGALSLSA